jgi:hypothetical protein
MRPTWPPTGTLLSEWSPLSEYERSRRAAERYALNQGLAEAHHARRAARRAQHRPPVSLGKAVRRRAARVLLAISRRLDDTPPPQARSGGVRRPPSSRTVDHRTMPQQGEPTHTQASM